MPTILSHPAAALALGSTLAERRLLIAGSVCTIIPDADVLAFYAGIPYAHPLGHRGFSHSLFFAVVLGSGTAWLWRRCVDRQARLAKLIPYFTLATMSHGLLDAMTDGGLGVGFFIPFNNERYFLPWRPIRVSPIGVAGFLERGLPVIASEIRWIWIPSAVAALAGTLLRKRRTKTLRS